MPTNEFVFPKGEDLKPYSGIPESYRDELLKSVMPYLKSSMQSASELNVPGGDTVKPYSGLPESYRDTLLSFAMPQLQSSVQDIDKNIDSYVQNALGGYRQEFDRYIKDEIPRQIGRLGERGVLDSTVASNTLSDTYRKAVGDITGRGYQTAMEGAKMKAGIPATMADIVNMGRYQEDPTVMANLRAKLPLERLQQMGNLLQYGRYDEDPTVMYRTLADLLGAQMV